MFMFESSHPVFQYLMKGEKETVEFLIKQSDLTSVKSEKFIAYPGHFKRMNLIEAAVYSGHVEMLHLIQEYFPALKPDNECLTTAARFNHLGVLQVLLDKDNLDPTYEKNKPIRFAAEYGSKDCVVFLQSIETVNAGDCENYALRKAVENKHHAVVKKLMIDKNVDVEVFDGLCLVIAAENNDQEMVRILVNDTPIDTSAQDYLALVRATERENREVVTFIYQRSLQQGKPFIFEEDDELSQRIKKLIMK